MKATIRVLNVRHGDCISVVLHGDGGESHSMVIDGGGKFSGVDIVNLLSRHGGLPAGSDGKPRIDLLIASHRDEDHLEGLVKVVESGKFDIRCAWAPIILTPNYDPLYRSRSLAEVKTFTEVAMRDPQGALDAALDDMESALMRRLPQEAKKRITEQDWLLEYVMPLSRSRSATDSVGGDTDKDPGLADRPLLAGLVSLGLQIGRHTGIATPDDFPLLTLCGRRSDWTLPNAFSEIILGIRSGFPFPYRMEINDYVVLLSRATVRMVSWVMRCTQFIQACKKKGVLLHMPMVADGQVSKDRLPGAPQFAGVDMQLLSPTRELVAKYASELAFPMDANIILLRAINYVTPANKASYVFTLSVQDDVALFTGDSGFNDFIFPWATKFKEERLAVAAGASWVKVPHHSGAFEYFARCFTHSAEQGNLSARIFVSSLGPDGTPHTTPSEEYESFALFTLEKMHHKPKFHFTNRPKHDRFDEVCPNCDQAGNGIGPEYLEYVNSGGNNWDLVNKAELICCKNSI